MTRFRNALIILLSCFTLFGLQACEDEGAFEDAGEGIDQGVDDTQDALEDAGDELDEEF